jgi:hypothetical protein
MERSVDAEVTEMIRRYSAEEVSLADLLCDAHAEAGADVLLCDGPDGESEMSYQ